VWHQDKKTSLLHLWHMLSTFVFFSLFFLLSGTIHRGAEGCQVQGLGVHQLHLQTLWGPHAARAWTSTVQEMRAPTSLPSSQPVLFALSPFSTHIASILGPLVSSARLVWFPPTRVCIGEAAQRLHNNLRLCHFWFSRELSSRGVKRSRAVKLEP